jgi:hypothetical protein
MKRSYLILLIALTLSAKAFGQTTLTEDANGVLNATKIVTQTSLGQTFFTGHQIGTGYYTSAPIFQAITDNTTAQNYFYSGLSGSSTTFSVRQDGQGYFAGNVGIGTSNPLTPLSVVGVATITVNNATGDNSNLLLYNNNALNTSHDPRGTIWVDNDGHLKLRSVTGYGTAFRNTSNTSDIMTVTDNGLSIGTSTMPSGYGFAVNGSAIATSMTVRQYPWSDYVFKKDYHLPSLNEVKAYVELNHHLPEIPSEKEIATNGLNLGDIDRLLTKKVEELTLYLIEKDKQLNEEKIIIDKQQQQNNLQDEVIKKISYQLESQQSQIELLIKQVSQRSKKVAE